MKYIAALSLFLVMLCTQASATVITTTFEGGNDYSGNMFNLTNVSGSAIELTGQFEGNFIGGTSGTIDVWYYNGSYVGHEGSASGWTLLGSSSYISLGNNTPTSFNIGNSLDVNSGEVIGLYFFTGLTNGLNYTNGSNIYNDGVVELELGIGTDDVAFSGGIFTPRTWNGSIEYTSASTVSEPALGALMIMGLISFVGLRRRSAIRLA